MEAVRPAPPSRVYVDGAFDLVHCGHFNAIRQAKLLSDKLIVGVCSDEGISSAKGKPVLTSEERFKVIESCRFVNECYPDQEYNVNEKTLDKFDCRYYAHGDDPCYGDDGIEMCEYLTKLGRFKQFKRTTGVSSTNITGRLLRLVDPGALPEVKEPPKQSFLQLASRIRNFATNKEPKPSDKIVYYQASFDLFHVGVLDRIKKAKEQGDFLYVGIWSDEMIRYYRGDKYPLLTMQERLLMALACKYVDDVVIEAPYIITEDLVKSLNISVVVDVQSEEDRPLPQFAAVDQFSEAKRLGIHH